MDVEKLFIVINRDPFNDFIRKGPCILLVFVPRGIQPPKDASYDQQYDQEQWQTAFAPDVCLPSPFHLETETGALNDIAIANEGPMFLFASENTPAISGADFEFHEVTMKT